MEDKRPFVPQTIHPAKFPARLDTGLHPEPTPGRRVKLYSQFLPQLPSRRFIVVLTGIKMPGTRGIPQSGRHVLAHRALLQKYLPGGVKNQNMHCTVPQALGMNHTPQFPAGHFIALVDHVKPLVIRPGLYIRFH